MIAIAISLYGKKTKAVARGEAPGICWGPRVFHVMETPFMNREGPTKKGTFVLLLKGAGAYTPRSPYIVVHQRW